MSRELLNVNQTETIKQGDDSTTIILSAHTDGEPATFKAGDIGTIKITTDSAKLPDIPVKLIVGSNNADINSKDLANLPAGDYKLELWVSQKDGPQHTIYPSSGALSLTIDRNADSLDGAKITTITLDDFKKQINEAIDEAAKHAARGPEGKQGKDGKSAYELAVESGFKGTETEWLDSLSHGPQGPEGKPGEPGKNGLSAYEEAKAAGFIGTEAQWLASLRGPEGPQGKQGEPGPAGKDGKDGQTGPQGLPGKDGQDGKSAYQEAVDAGFKGTETEWLASLRGPEGPQGQPGKQGEPGQPGKDGATGPQGQPGKDGVTPKLSFAPVQTLPSGSQAKADIEDQGNGNYVVTLSIPAGPKGETGGINQVIEPDLNIGTVTTVDAGQDAAASLTKTGETSYAINLSIPAGPAGQRGMDGKDGKAGADGKSAYELAVAKGFSGDLDNWLASLRGPQGPQGEPGPAGKDGHDGSDGQQGPAGEPGQPGKDGDSAYQVAVKNGYSGTEKEWLASLRGPEGPQGPQGEPGQSGKDGKDGQQGPQGVPGTPGKDGKDASLPSVDAYAMGEQYGAIPGASVLVSGNKWTFGFTIPEGKPGEQGPEGKQGPAGNPGPAGEPGKDGKDGKSAYQIAQDHGFKGTEEEWLASLKGKDGSSETRVGNDPLPMESSLIHTFMPYNIAVIPTALIPTYLTGSRMAITIDPDNNGWKSADGSKYGKLIPAIYDLSNEEVMGDNLKATITKNGDPVNNALQFINTGNLKVIVTNSGIFVAIDDVDLPYDGTTTTNSLNWKQII